MKKRKGIIGLIVILAILVLGIGYAIEADILTINGTLSASVNDANFAVEFDNSNDKQPVKTCTVDGATATATYTNATTATFSVTDFTSQGDTATFEYEIVNKSTSEDLIAQLSANVSNLNNNYFNVTTSFKNDINEITTAETATLTVTVTMIKTPISDTQATEAGTNGTVTITANAIDQKTI